MKKVKETLHRGQQFYRENGEELFDEFFRLFKRSFSKVLKPLRAGKIRYTKGFFYISGFYTIGSQAYYFSLSDVRENSREPMLLIRKADSYQDFTGEDNRYFLMRPNMWKQIANGFDIVDVDLPKAYDKTIIINSIVNGNGIANIRVESSKRAFFIISGILKAANIKDEIYETKLGREIMRVYHKGDDVLVYDATTRRLNIKLNTEYYNNKRKLALFLNETT